MGALKVAASSSALATFAMALLKSELADSKGERKKKLVHTGRQVREKEEETRKHDKRACQNYRFNQHL